MTTEKVYPIIIQMNTQEVHIGSAKVEFDTGSMKNNTHYEHNATLKDIKLNFKVGDWIAKVLSRWN